MSAFDKLMLKYEREMEISDEEWLDGLAKDVGDLMKLKIEWIKMKGVKNESGD